METRTKGTFTNTVTALILILIGALLFFTTLRSEQRRTGFGDEDGKRYLGALLALTGVGAALRFGVDPTFIQEACASLNRLVGETIDLGAAIDAYPQGPDLTVSTIGLWLTFDPFDAWFTVHQPRNAHIFVAFGAGKALLVGGWSNHGSAHLHLASTYPFVGL